MTAIATLSGRVIDYLDPDPEQIILDDIAAGLSVHPRYSGQTLRAWSVAQHSMLVAHLVSPQYRLHALLHDAPEAFLCDVPSPAKDAMRVVSNGEPSSYDVIERNLWTAICIRYDISHEMPDEVKRADRTAMVIEAPVLQPKGWCHPVWDFARDEELELGGVHRGLFLRLQALPNGGRLDWLWATVDELHKRKAAA